MKSTAVRREEQGQTAEKQDRTRRFRISTGHRVVFRSYTVMPINKKKIDHREMDKALYIYKKIHRERNTTNQNPWRCVQPQEYLGNANKDTIHLLDW